MKTLATILCVFSSLVGASAQGLINFFNNSSTLVSAGPSEIYKGSYYFALLTSPVGADTFTFVGVYGTNQTVRGRFNGGFAVAIPGWAPGTARDFEVVGWSGSLGHDFNSAWLDGDFGGVFGFFGISAVGTGQAGGPTAIGTLPNLNIFGGASGIQQGFDLVAPLIPEPSILSLAGLGAAALLAFRRRRNR